MLKSTILNLCAEKQYSLINYTCCARLSNPPFLKSLDYHITIRLCSNKCIVVRKIPIIDIKFTSSKLTRTDPQQTPKRTKNWSSNETLLLNVLKKLRHVSCYKNTLTRSLHFKNPNYILFAQKFSVVWYLNSIRYLNFQPLQYTLSRQFCPVKLKTCKSFRKNCFIFYCP